MKVAGKETLYFSIGAGNRPTLTVKPGEDFKVVTQMNRGPWLKTHPRGRELSRKINGPNPTSGCVCVDGARPGDLLAVTVKKIVVGPVGFTHFPGQTDALPSWVGPGGVGEQGKVVKIKGGFVHWSRKLKLPVRPMLGYVGTAPETEVFSNAWGGRFGGNLDVQELGPGTTILLPVAVPGALLHVGDMHAIQGDGEICGSGGIETEGEAVLRCAVRKRPRRFRWPRLENRTHVMVAACARPAEDAFREGLVDLLGWLEEDYGLERGEAFIRLGQVLEARVTQFVDPTFTYLLKVDKKYLK